MDSFFSQYLLKLRKKSKLSQSKFADILGVSTNTICSIENGNSKLPNKKLLNNIAKYNKENSIITYRDIIFAAEKSLKKQDLITLYASWYTKYGHIIYYYCFDNINLCDSVIAYKKDNPTNFTLYIDINELLTKYKTIDNAILLSEFNKVYEYYTNEVPGLLSSHAQYRNRPNTIKTAHFVFDNNNQKHLKAFSNLKKNKNKLSILKINIYSNLFDTKTFKINDTAKL